MPTPYRNSLFSCRTPFTLASFGLCLKASFFPCVVSGRNYYRIKHGNDYDYYCCN
ncbi:hypothetical protein F5882DRAFT_310441 [Hyaloscypha sp. PMI_1271]|nr:hypothetical protein F5882DRAFT_310441 [Hyaloscypha sp. PMI_1271]